MPRPQTKSDDEILSAAREVLLERGPSASLTAIARAVGLSQPAISQRFGSREALVLRALTPRRLSRWLAAVRVAPADGDARETLLLLGTEALEVLREAVPCLLTLRVSRVDIPPLAGDGPAPHEAVEAAVVGWFAKAADAGALSPGNAEARATAFIGALQAHAMRDWISNGPELPAATVARSLVDVLWTGLAPTPQGE